MKKACNLVIIGAGTAGLGAAIRAASEGIPVILIDRQTSGYGGQAGTSTLIENYPGFPQGVTGAEFAALLLEQAEKFGVNFRAPFSAMSMKLEGNCWKITEEGGEEIEAGMVLMATGVNYRTLNATNVAHFVGRGISYGSPSYLQSFAHKKVGVVGGGNSAAQAALHLASGEGCEVIMIVRGESFTETMSDVYVHRIMKCENIKVHFQAQVELVEGTHEAGLQKVHLVSEKAGASQHSIEHLFVLIGAVPKTVWLNSLNLSKDSRGFIKTGADISSETWASWNAGRPPFSHEAAPGLFVAGDIHSGNFPSITSAVGDATIAVNNMHSYIYTIWTKLAVETP